MSPKHADCRHVNISDEEHKFGLNSLENVQAGVEEFHRDGIVIFENAIPHNVVEKFYEKMNADGAQRLEDPSLVYNHGMEKNYFSLCPPLSKEWLSQYIWANKHAAAVMEAVIGKPQLVHAGSTITIPTQEPTSRQAVHIDSYHNHHKFPTCIELFMYLHNVSPENGSPEIWPGSHHNWNFRDLVSHGRGWIKSSAFNRRAEHSPPFQPTIPKGSIGIRDLCLWRSGMPNLSDQNCIMLGFTYFPRWYRNPMRITLPKNCRFAMQKWTQVDAIGATEFVDGEINHLDPDFDMLASLNYTQDPEKSIKQIREKIDTAQGREPNADLTVTDRDYWVPGRKKLVERVTHGEGEGNQWNQGNQGDRGKGRNKGRGKDIGRYK